MREYFGLGFVLSSLNHASTVWTAISELPQCIGAFFAMSQAIFVMLLGRSIFVMLLERSIFVMLLGRRLVCASCHLCTVRERRKRERDRERERERDK
jgi:hypothetical protein